MTIAHLDLRRMRALSGGAAEQALLRASRSGRYVLGPEVEAFEAEFAAWCGTDHAVGVGNGLEAIELLLRAHGVGPGDDVLVPSNTYIATWLAVSAVGARPVPVEPDPWTHVITAHAVEAALTPTTAAVVPVHLYGLCADVAGIRAVAEPRGVTVVTDAAQAHGASREGVRAGALARAEAFSFYPTKNLGAYGDGGAVTTSDGDLADRLRVLRNYGSRRRYHHEERGLNSRLDELQAAVLRAHLPLVDGWNARRAAIAARYREELADVPDLVLPTVPDGLVHAWHVFSVRHPHRDHLQAALAERGVGTQVFYPVPPHRSGAYADAGIDAGALPVATALAATSLALPVAPYLDDDEVSAVVEAVKDAAAHLTR